MRPFRSWVSRFKRHDVAQGHEQTNQTHPVKNNTGKKPAQVLKVRLLSDRFPWTEEKRVIKRRNFTLTTYLDGSRLYQFNNGGYIILTTEGVSILKSDRHAIKRYFKGEKAHLVNGGNSMVHMFKAGGYPTIVKEHHHGQSAVGQMEHARQIYYTLKKEQSFHSAPEYYAVGSFPAGRFVRDVSAMELLPGKKVEDIKNELEANPTPENMKRLHKMLDDYKALEHWLRKKKLPLTDFHRGNILATYAKDLGRYIFGIIDQ